MVAQLFMLRYRLVWTETLKTYREMIAVEKWEEKGTVNVPVIQSLTFKVCHTLTDTGDLFAQCVITSLLSRSLVNVHLDSRSLGMFQR